MGKVQAAPQLRSALARTKGIVAVARPRIRGDLALVQGTLSGQPDDMAAYATIGRVRTAAHAVPGADAKVGGGTAITLDLERYATRDRNVIMPLFAFVFLVALRIDYNIFLMTRVREESRRSGTRPGALTLDIGRWMWRPSRLAARWPERSVPAPVPATALR